MLFDECIDLFATLPINANLNRVAVMAKMNIGPLARVISIDVEDPNAAQCHTLWMLLANLANKSGSMKQSPSDRKGHFCNAFELRIIIGRSLMSMVKVLIMRILTTEVTDSRRQLEAKIKDVANVGCDGLDPDMAVIALVHAKHGFGLGMRCKSAHGQKEKNVIIVICWKQKLNLHNLDFVVI